jgi:hypothetical protein
VIRLGFEPATPVFERAKTVPALDRAATVVGRGISAVQNKSCRWHKNRAVYCETPRFIRAKDSLIQYASLFVHSVSILIEINNFSSFSPFYLRMRKGVNLHPAIVRSETAVKKLIDRCVFPQV